jgi:4-hydroxy-4-methyl-2-oxoglutarate aldolase
VRPVIVTGTPRAPLAEVDALGRCGVATVHEAMGRDGLLDPRFRPIAPRAAAAGAAATGAVAAGTAVTVLCRPGDNLMIHAAVEQCRAGDLLVVTTSSACQDGLFGELLAVSLHSRGVRGLVISAGVRDTAAIAELGFPVWSTAVSAQGTGKAAAGAVNVPIVIGGATVRPGDAIVADDDGVVCVPRASVADVLAAAKARAAREDETRAALAAGELGLDRYHLRAVLERLGVAYVPYQDPETP